MDCLDRPPPEEGRLVQGTVGTLPGRRILRSSGRRRGYPCGLYISVLIVLGEFLPSSV